MKVLLLWEIVIVTWLIGNGTLCPIQSVVILDFVNHLYDYRLNWTLLSPVTIMITLLNRQE